MTQYEVRQFQASLELADDEELAGVELVSGGASEARSVRNIALVKVGDGFGKCGYPTDNGECQREPSGDNDRCWQHQND